MKKLRYLTFALIASLAYTACGNENKSDQNSDSTVVEETTKTDSPKKLTVEEQVEQIRIDFQSIESGISSYTVEEKSYRNPDPEMYYDMSNYTSYNKGAELVKLDEEMGEEGYYSKASYYFKNGKVFFIFTEVSYMDDLFLESRVYFDSDKVIKAVKKEKEPDPEDNSVKLSSLSNVPDAEFVKDPAAFNAIQMALVQSALTRLKASGPRE